ncbi:uncharacterized protein zf(cchc)-6 [Ciona intestinalis]
MTVTAHLPTPPLEVVTLHPVPCFVDERKIKNLVEKNKWGKVNNMSFGFHRNFKDIKNGWLNVYFENLNVNNLPKVAKICGKWATVTRPGESHLPLCRFCKERGHVQTRCPKKGFCTYCKTEGHITKNCRSKPTNPENKKAQPWIKIQTKTAKDQLKTQPKPIESTNKFAILQMEPELNSMDHFPSLEAATSPKEKEMENMEEQQTPRKQRTPKSKKRSKETTRITCSTPVKTPQPQIEPEQSIIRTKLYTITLYRRK